MVFVEATNQNTRPLEATTPVGDPVALVVVCVRALVDRWPTAPA
jgi:hypothetical protein